MKDPKVLLAEYNSKIFEAGHCHDTRTYNLYTKKAVILAEALGLKYKITGYGLKFL